MFRVLITLAFCRLLQHPLVLGFGIHLQMVKSLVSALQ